MIKFKDMRYRVWNISEGLYEEGLTVDNDGTIFEMLNEWGCEGGGGSEDRTYQDNYEVHVTTREIEPSIGGSNDK